MVLEHEHYSGLDMDGCFGGGMVLEHEHCRGVGMDALVSVWPWNTSIILVWACMLW